MSRLIVHAFEPINIEEHEAQRCPGTPRARHLAYERLFTASAIGEPGDLVGQRQTRQRRKPLLAVRTLNAAVEFQRETLADLAERIERARVERQRFEIKEAHRAADAAAGRDRPPTR